MTNIYISNARKAAQLSLQGRRELIGFGVSKTRLGICSVYKWQEITLFVLQHNPNFKKKLFIWCARQRTCDCVVKVHCPPGRGKD